MSLPRRLPSLLLAAVVCAAVFSTAGCGGCQPGGEAEKTQPQEGQAEVDCFIIVDGEPDFGGAPLKVQFETEVDCTASPVKYSWDFGDGSKGGNEANPVHVYEKPGDYVAVVKAMAPDGGSGDDEMDITVDEPFEE